MLVLFVKQLNILICRNACYSKNSIDHKIVLGAVKCGYLISCIDVITLNSDRHMSNRHRFPTWTSHNDIEKNEPLCRMASFQVEAQMITIHILQR